MKVWKANEIIQPYENGLLNLQEQNIYWHHVQWLRHTSAWYQVVSLCILMAATWRAWICMCVFASVLPFQRTRSRVSSGREPLTVVWIRSVSAQRKTSCSLLDTNTHFISSASSSHPLTAESRAYTWEEDLFITNKWIKINGSNSLNSSTIIYHAVRASCFVF